MALENTQIAGIFDEIADLLELQSANPFRVRSYRNAAQTVRSLSDRLENLAEQGEDLSKLNNIGKSTADKIREIIDTGTCKRLENLREEVPEGLPELMHIPGVGPRKAVQLHVELGVDSIDDLKKAAEKGRVRELEGMGKKTEQNILQGIETVKHTAGRLLLSEASDYFDTLAKYLNGLSELDRWDVAGSFRRGKETIGDFDILVRADDREKAADAILAYDAVDEVIGRGRERVSVRLRGGVQIDFRFFDEPAFGSALMYFTGSKSHNIRLRKIAQERGWKLNEYGLFKDTRRLAGKTEEAVYQRLHLDWVPPELREDRGELDAAAEGRLPDLIDADDIQGDLQCHTTASDGKNTIEEMAQAAKDFGHTYLAITDHSHRVTMAQGLDDDRAKKHADAIRKVDDRMKRFRLLAGIEVDILKSGKLDLKEKTLEGLDWVVASVHYNRNMSRKAMTDRMVSAVKSGVVHCLGHPLGRLIGQREPMAVDLDRLFAACAEHNVWMEINGQPERLDLPDVHCRHARDAGVQFTFGTDAHSTDGLRFMSYAVRAARRGWLTKDDVLNTKNISQLEKELKRR